MNSVGRTDGTVNLSYEGSTDLTTNFVNCVWSWKLDPRRCAEQAAGDQTAEAFEDPVAPPKKSRWREENCSAVGELLHTIFCIEQERKIPYWIYIRKEICTENRKKTKKEKNRTELL
jgi:hypothetical protein